MPRPKFSDRKVRELLARRLQEVRIERGWTREQLAEAVGLSAVQTIWKYETARLSISVTMLYRFAAALGIPVEALVKEVSPRTAEAEMLAAWRRLNEREQATVLYLAQRLSEGPPKPAAKPEASPEVDQ
jgi:putative transcriptional regulator